MPAKSITVEVTAEDIAAGFPRDCRNCPVALALKRAFGRTDIEVAHFRIAIGDGRIVSPYFVDDFINEFDKGRPVVPFTFTLDLEDSCHAG